jgi:hypothetical protein
VHPEVLINAPPDRYKVVVSKLLIALADRIGIMGRDLPLRELMTDGSIRAAR